MDDGWWVSDVVLLQQQQQLIRIAVAKRDDDDNNDELRIRCRFAINRQNPPTIYRQISLRLTTLRGRRAQATTVRWTLRRVEYVRRLQRTARGAHISADICQTLEKLSRVDHPRTAVSPSKIAEHVGEHTPCLGKMASFLPRDAMHSAVMLQ